MSKKWDTLRLVYSPVISDMLHALKSVGYEHYIEYRTLYRTGMDKLLFDSHSQPPTEKTPHMWQQRTLKLFANSHLTTK